jgi:hypothetical protein
VIVAELFPPTPGSPRRRSTSSVLLALGVVVTGLALAVTALLPWVGVTAQFSVLDAEISRAVRGVDAGSGWCVLGAGIAAMLLGVLGATRNWLFTGLAILPGAVAAFALAMFLTDPQDLAIQYGWFAGLLSSVVVAVLATAAFLRRR